MVNAVGGWFGLMLPTLLFKNFLKFMEKTNREIYFSNQVCSALLTSCLFFVPAVAIAVANQK